eukprot:TRINITY_DN22777_c0_g1_i1.p1 TRINITY_DN22777_c0_g1~~TRINITY_DN22777_c0_g1_i1.p1  ORF type:complete len:503 (+),score=143.58 TRINITY_DN22777_c0_g1_i1:40-1548(+)
MSHPTLTQEELPSVPHKDDKALDVFAHELTDMLIKYMLPDAEETDKIVDFLTPDSLKEKLDFVIREEPEALQEVLLACKKTIQYSVNTGHVHFFNQLFAKVDVIAQMGEWLTTTLNASMYTYEVAPVFTLMEQAMLEKVGGLVEFTEVDGIFAPGGSMSNLYSLLAARHRKYPDVKTKGMNGKMPVVFASEHSHYSTTKGCIMLGIGTDSCVKVACHKDGTMDVADLKKKIEECIARGQEPMYVTATSGTTVYGAFDNLEEIVSVSKEHGMWVHVDGAWGGSVMLSRKRRHLLKGIEACDSFTWNPHKMMGIPLQCSCVVLNNKKGLLQQAVGTSAGYLFQADKLYPIEYDTGDKAYQCGRRVDAFKLWLVWKARGDLGMEAVVEGAFKFADMMVTEIKKRPSFELVTEPMCTNVCFWCVPPEVKQLEKEEKYEILNKIAPLVKQDMQRNGTTMIGYQQLGPLPNFWRMICITHKTTLNDVTWLLDLIEEYTHKSLGKCIHG